MKMEELKIASDSRITAGPIENLGKSFSYVERIGFAELLVISGKELADVTLQVEDNEFRRIRIRDGPKEGIPANPLIDLQNFLSRNGLYLAHTNSERIKSEIPSDWTHYTGDLYRQRKK